VWSTCVGLIDTGTRKLRLVELSRRGRFIAVSSRALAIALSLAWIAVAPPAQISLKAAMLLLAGYSLYALLSLLRDQLAPPVRGGRVVADVIDAGWLAGISATTGGTASPLWLLFYPHVVAVAVRTRWVYSLAIATLDALLLYAVGRTGPPEPLASVQPLALVWCAFVGGSISSHLLEMRTALGRANRELKDSNAQLRETLSANEGIRSEQEKALTRLRESEEGYRRLLERIQDGVLIVQEGGRVAYSNLVFASMIGEIPSALVGTDLRDLVPSEDRGELSDRYHTWQSTQAFTGAFETRILTRRGGRLLVSVRAGAAEFEGRPCIITTVRDITRERQIEEELRDHAERLAAIDEIANAVNQSLSVDDTFRLAAHEARRLLRFDRLTAALLDETGQAVEVIAVGPARGGRSRLPRADVEWAFKRPTLWSEGEGDPPAELVRRLLGHPGVLCAAALPLHSRGRLIGVLSFGRDRPDPFTSWDLTVVEPVVRHIAIALDNARLFEAVKHRGSELESLLELSRGISGRLDLGELLPMVTRSVNRLMGTQHCMLLLREGDELRLGAQEGLEPETVAAIGTVRIGESLSGWAIAEGRPLAVYEMKDDPRLRFREVVERYGYRSFFCVPLRRGEETMGTLEVITKVPRRFTPAEQDLMTLLGDQAAVAIENARLYEEARGNLAQVQAANRQLEQLDLLRQQYLRNVSHEFRTPLTVIKGYTEHLSQSGPPDEAAFREILRILGESSDRLMDLVDTLLEVSRVEQSSARESLRIRPLDLRELVMGSIADLQAAAGRKQVILSVDLPGPLALEGDLGLLQQVVRKLVDNAVKYNRAGGRVEIRGRVEEKDILLEVEDLGIGIAPEHLPRIFEKFYTVDGGLDRRAGGAGVGLYLVREILRLHGGRVDVESRPGQGSLFSVRLPRESPTRRTAIA
jgi:PAS domain S-box-containing protein